MADSGSNKRRADEEGAAAGEGAAAAPTEANKRHAAGGEDDRKPTPVAVATGEEGAEAASGDKPAAKSEATTVFSGATVAASVYTGGQSALAAPAAAQDLAARFLLSPKNTGYVIGKGGATINYIRENSHTKINITDNDSPETDRIMVVEGSLNALYAAFTYIATKLAEPTEEGGVPKPASLRMLVPHTQAGAVIGKSGSKMKEIREASRAQIQLEKDPLPGSTERLCTVTGDPQAVATALFHICSILLVTPLKAPTIDFKPGVAQQMQRPYGAYGGAPAPQYGAAQSYGAQGYGGAQQYYPGYGQGPLPVPTPYPSSSPALHPQAPPSNPILGNAVNMAPQTHTMMVPNDMVGSIIGKGGSKISEIRTMSMAQVKIADPTPGSYDRMVTITGSMDAIQRATYMIQAKIQEVMMQNSIPRH